jgi:hypothetical protein
LRFKNTKKCRPGSAEFPISGNDHLLMKLYVLYANG